MKRSLLVACLVQLGCGPSADQADLTRKVAQLERRVLKLESAGARGRSKVRSPATRRRAAGTPGPEATVAALVQGDALRVFLRQGDRRLPLPGRVPPGTYEIRARFDLDAPVRAAGEIELTDGEKVTIACDRANALCQRQ